MRILLVQDEPDLAKPLVDLLRREFYEVVHACHTPLALKALEERGFDWPSS